MANGVPILLVPGFLANELATQKYAYGWIPGQTIWLSYPRMIAGAWQFLGLDASGQHNLTPFVGDLVQGGPLHTYYGIFLQYFGGRNYTLLAAYNDWRQSLTFDATNLAQQIRANSDYAPINIACHSRGGLVTRIALHMLLESGELGLVGRVAGFGVPHSGTLEATKTMAGFGQPLELVNNLINLGARAAGPLGVPDQLLVVFRSWPGLYELQPSPGAPWLNPGDGTELNDPLAWQAVNPPVSPTWINDAAQSWATLPPVPSGVPWLDVVGDNWPTPQGLVRNAIPTNDAGMTWTDQGDGVVVTQSARLGTGPQVTAPTRHSALVQDTRILELVDLWFQGRLRASVEIGPPAVE